MVLSCGIKYMRLGHCKIIFSNTLLYFTSVSHVNHHLKNPFVLREINILKHIPLAHCFQGGLILLIFSDKEAEDL